MAIRAIRDEPNMIRTEIANVRDLIDDVLDHGGDRALLKALADRLLELRERLEFLEAAAAANRHHSVHWDESA